MVRGDERLARELTAPRLHADPGALQPAGRTDPVPGLARLEAADGLVYVPAHRPDPAPLAVLLHGSGSDPRSGLAPLLPFAEEAGLVLAAPASREYTWDLLVAGYGPDPPAIDALLVEVLSRTPVDQRRVALGGFSDGASYALSLGLANPQLFTHLIAFSPGFVRAGTSSECPRVYVSHGTEDTVLPIERCGRRVVATLRAIGCSVDYREFHGGHSAPSDIVSDAVRWML